MAQQSTTWLDQAKKLYDARQFAGAQAAAMIDIAISLRVLADDRHSDQALDAPF